MQIECRTADPQKKGEKKKKEKKERKEKDLCNIAAAKFGPLDGFPFFTHVGLLLCVCFSVLAGNIDYISSLFFVR